MPSESKSGGEGHHKEEFKETSGSRATLDCKLKRLAQEMALIERVGDGGILELLELLELLQFSSFVFVQSVTGQFQINIFEACRTQLDRVNTGYLL